MKHSELTYQMALTLLDGIGDVLAKNLIAYCGSAEQVFKTRNLPLERVPGIGAVLSKSVINGGQALQRAEEELRFIEDHRIRPIFFTDKDYPQRLKNCHDGPVMLYYKGNANLNALKVVSVVGTRTPSTYGKAITEKLIQDLKESGCLVLSGLAYGIDILAHKGALEQGLHTVGVLAHGLDRIYPSVHKTYAERMLNGGGLLTEFMSKTNPDRENFPKRNRIVAGMCDALIVVESKREGGSLITATIANSYHKDVFAFPGKAGEALSEGCNGLIKTNRAHLIESASDLFYIMNWNKETQPAKKSRQIPLLLNFTTEEQAIVTAFSGKSNLHIDEICHVTGMPVSKASSCLLNLEFSNIISSLPGKIYTLK